MVRNNDLDNFFRKCRMNQWMNEARLFIMPTLWNTLALRTSSLVGVHFAMNLIIWSSIHLTALGKRGQQYLSRWPSLVRSRKNLFIQCFLHRPHRSYSRPEKSWRFFGHTTHCTAMHTAMPFTQYVWRPALVRLCNKWHLLFENVCEDSTKTLKCAENATIIKIQSLLHRSHRSYSRPGEIMALLRPIMLGGWGIEQTVNERLRVEVIIRFKKKFSLETQWISLLFMRHAWLNFWKAF